MNNDQISFLAREYVEETMKSVYEYLHDYPRSTAAKEILDLEIRNTTAVLSWLCSRYCLAEKEKVNSFKEKSIKGCRETEFGSRGRYFHGGRLALLKLLFP